MDVPHSEVDKSETLIETKFCRLIHSEVEVDITYEQMTVYHNSYLRDSAHCPG